MSLPTLRTILELPAFREAELLSGHTKLDRVIGWVHVAEVLDAWRFLSGGELILSTGVELARVSPEEQGKFLRALDQAGAHGLAIELGQWMQQVPLELLDTARQLDFPLLAFHAEVRFADLTRAAHERILRPSSDPQNDPPLQSILDALIETGRDKHFLARQLGPLLLLPSRPKATLVATLEALLETSFNIAQAARRLGVRRQSIYYRLDQLHGLLGPLDNQERYVGLAIALALLRRDAV